MTQGRAAGVLAGRRVGSTASWRLGAIALFLGLPLGAAAVAAYGLVASLDASNRADHADETARTIIHQLDRRRDTAATPPDTTPLFLANSSASLAQAELQALVSKRIEASGGRLVQLQPLDATDQDPPGRVAVEITFDSGNAGLLEALHALETGLPILDVPRLDARAEAPADGSGRAGDLLRVTMTVQGTWKAPVP